MVSVTTSITTTNTFTLNKKTLLSSSSSKKLSEHGLNTKLTEIFNKIGNLDIAQQGIQELYEFLLEYPESDVKVNMFLANSGSFFQKYIRKALNDITKREMQKIGMIPTTTTSSTRTSSTRTSSTATSPTTSLPSSPTSFSTSLPSSLTSSTTSLSSTLSAENSLNDNDTNTNNNNDNNSNNNNDNNNNNNIISTSNTSNSNSNSQILPKKPPHKFIINRCPNVTTNTTSLKEDKEIKEISKMSTTSITNNSITTIPSSSSSSSEDISSEEISNTSVVNDEDKDDNNDNSTKSKHTLSQEFLDNLTKETFEITRTRLFNIFQIEKYKQDNRRASLPNLETFKSDAERLENAKHILQTRFGINPRRATWSGLSIQQQSVF